MCVAVNNSCAEWCARVHLLPAQGHLRAAAETAHDDSMLLPLPPVISLRDPGILRREQAGEKEQNAVVYWLFVL